MRPFIIAAMLTVSLPIQATAQMMPTATPTTYPEAGTFCGFLTLCTQSDRVKADK